MSTTISSSSTTNMSSSTTSKSDDADKILNNPLKVLKLLDAYGSYHNDGTDSMKKAFWNLTKSRYRSNGGMGSALSMPSTVTTLSSSLDSNDESNAGNVNSGTLIFSILNPRNELQTRCVVSVQSTNADSKNKISDQSGSIIYKLIDPVEQRRLQVEEEKENATASELIDEEPSPDLDFVDDPTQSTGLRQRGGKQKQNMTTMAKSEENSKSTTTLKVDEVPNVQQKNLPSTTTTTKIIVDPFDDNMIMVMNLYGCSSSHRNEIKLAQQKAIQSLQNYVNAATLVAAIQHELNTNNRTTDTHEK
jgi:hypothetical protein